MEDRKNLFVVIFITFFVMVYVQWMFPQTMPNPQSTANAPAQQTSAAATAPIGTPTQTSVAPTTGSRPSESQLKESPVSVIDTGSAIIEINHLGARIQSIKLKSYTRKLQEKDRYEMIEHLEGAGLPGAVYAEKTNDDYVLYSLDPSSSAQINGSMYKATETPINLTFNGTLSTGNSIQKTFGFSPNGFLLTVEVKLGAPASDGQPVWLEWTYTHTAESIKEEGSNTKRISFLNNDKKLTNTNLSGMPQGSVENGNGLWAGVADYYFFEAILNPGGYFRSAHEGDLFYVRSAATPGGGKFGIYAGPKDLEMLSAVGSSLERSVDLGIFSFLAHPILSLIKFFYRFIGNYGLAIILLTLLIKLFFLPLTQASFKSMQAMQDLQPEIKALRERVEDPNVLNQELMSLYKKRGVNPLGGCLPVLIQIPVFLGLYNALLNSIDLRHEPFALWIQDLSAPERLHLFGLNIPLMIILMGISMFLQQKMQPSSLDPAQQKVMLIMPIVFTGLFILHPMPSGLVLYWLVNNSMSIVQQLYIRGHRNGSPLVATAYASLAILSLGFLLVWIS